MKKHELLIKAMRDYPNGTKFKSTFDGLECTSNGIFSFGCFGDVETGGRHCYDLDTDKWAEIVTEKPKSILDGKVAIEINNKRELQLFNENSKYKYYPAECYEYPLYMGHTQHGFSSNKYFYEKRNYTIISFEDFAKETGIEVPVFAIKSIDGVDLFFGDKIHRSWWDNFTNKWRYDNCTLSNDRNAVITGVDQAKAFSTKEAAEIWILEANKLQEIVLFEDQPVKVIVTKGGFKTECDEMIHEFDAAELKEIYKSFKKLC